MKHLQCQGEVGDLSSLSASPSPSPSLTDSRSSISWVQDETSLVDGDPAQESVATALFPTLENSRSQVPSLDNSLVQPSFVAKSIGAWDSEQRSLHDSSAMQSNLAAENCAGVDSPLLRGSSESSFPALAASSAAPGDFDRSSPAPLTQLSLQSIATGFLGWSETDVHNKSAEDICFEPEKVPEVKTPAPVNTRAEVPSESTSEEASPLVTDVVRKSFHSEPHRGIEFSQFLDLVAESKAADHQAVDHVRTGVEVPKNGCGDNTVPDSWEMYLSSDDEAVGPTGDAPVSYSEESTSSSYTSAQQDLSSKDEEDADAWSWEDPLGRVDLRDGHPQSACQKKETLYGFENDSDDSMDSFYEAEYGPDEFVPSLPGTVGQVSAGNSKRHNAERPWRGRDENSTQHRRSRIPGGDNTERSQGAGVDVSDIGCLPGETIRTMPRHTRHTNFRNKTPEKFAGKPENSAVSGKPESVPGFSSPRQQALAPSASVLGYERGDLASKDETAPPKPKGKQKFRPFMQHLQPVQSTQQAEAAKQPWVPVSKCTKCGEHGHMRYDCQNKGTNFFLD